MNRGLKWGITAALIGIGVAALVSVIVANGVRARTDGWTQARGTIERIEARADGSAVTYSYEAGGRAHRSTATLASAGGYQAGATVIVYVNPENTAESLLQLPRRPPLWPIPAGVVAIMAGGALGAFFWQEERTRRAKTAARKAAPPLSRLKPPPPVVRK